MSWLGELGGPFRWTSLSCAGLIARRPGHGKRGAPAEISTMHGGIHNNAQLARWPAGRLQVALTTLRKLIGRHSLDEVLKEREELAATMCRAIDTASKPWREKVTRMEMGNLAMPESMQRAMAQEAEALREKRARIIERRKRCARWPSRSWPIRAVWNCPHADGDPGGGRAEHRHDHHDAERVRVDGARDRGAGRTPSGVQAPNSSSRMRLRTRKSSGALGKH